jgi:type IV pilus assembly protein PilA
VGFTLVEVMIVVAILGVLASLAIPNFIKFQARSKQAEVKTNLKGVFTGQRARFSERDAYTNLIGEIGFAPERGNRYSYDLGATPATANATVAFTCATMEDRSAATVVQAPACGVQADVFRYSSSIVAGTLTSRAPIVFSTAAAGNAAMTTDAVGVFGTCPACDFAARAIGNVDNDAAGDEWFISSQFITTAAATACAELTASSQPGAAFNAHNDVNCDQ